MTGTEYVPEVAHPARALRRSGLGIRVGVVERVTAIGPQHNGTGLAEHHLRVEDPHQVDHPQVLALIPGAVVVDGTGLGVGHRAGVDLGVRKQPVVGQPKAGLLSRGEVTQGVGPLLEAAGVGQVFEQLVGWAVDVVVDRAVLAEDLVVRVHRPHLRHEHRGGLLKWRGLDADHSLDRLGRAAVGGDIFKRCYGHGIGSPCDVVICCSTTLLAGFLFRNAANGGISSAAHSTLTTEGPSTAIARSSAAGSSSMSATSTEDSPGNMLARPAASWLGANRL